jgi:formylglycine-generating enzyme required for sulfatase activity
VTLNNPLQSGSIAFGEFLAHLRAKGFKIGVDRHLRLQQLLERVEGQCAPDELKTLLCPLFATSRQQQQEFYRAFDEFFAIFQPPKPPPPPPPPPKQDRAPRRRFRLTAAVAFVLLLVAVAALLATQRFRLLAGVERIELPAPQFPPPPAMPRPAQPKIVDVIPAVSTGTAIVPPPRDWVLERAWRLRLAALLAPLLLFAAWWLWRWWRRRPVIEKARGRRPPFTWPIELEREEWRLDRAQTFYQAARGLRRRQRADHRQLDLERTIEATVAARGYPSFQFRQASRPPEYLALIDRASRQDHQARLFDQLAGALERDGLFVIRYFYDGDPRICRPAAPASAQDVLLADLFRRYPAHRLVVMGDGARLFDPVTGAPEEWAEAILEWPERALLTPASLPAWGRRERWLAGQFTLLPATLAGLAELADRYESPLRAEPPRGDPASNAEAPPETAYGVTLDELRDYLGPGGFRWLCATAVYPELQWELTLRVGQLAAPEQSLDEAALWRLLRLPWFREGAIPDEIRLELVRSLDADLDRRVRQFLIETLERNPAEEGTFAADERRLDIAVQRAYLAGDDRRARKDAIEEIEHITPGELERDYTLLRLLSDRPTSLLALVLPARLRRLFYPAGASHFRMKWQAALGLALLAVLLGSGGLESIIRYKQARRPQATAQPAATAESEVTFTLTYVPGGSFMMGSPPSEEGRTDDEGPQHLVTLPGFYMGETEVTQAQWRRVAQLPKVNIDLDPDPSNFKGDDLPVELVSWNEAVEFCERLSKATGRKYRLPTEAEWEYAARAGTSGPYAGNLDAMAWYFDNSDGKTHFVKGKQPNAWELYDMHGNVWEWCEDVWHDNYNGAPADGSAWLSGGDSSFRLLRGGSWGSQSIFCRSAIRINYWPDDRDSSFGVRVVVRAF